MIGGFINNGTLALATYEPELQEMIRIALDKEYQLPSKLNLDAINQCMRELKLASVTGDLRGYSTIRIYGNDLVWSNNRTGDIGFTGMWWNRPEIGVQALGFVNKNLGSLLNVATPSFNRVNTQFTTNSDSRLNSSDFFTLWHFEGEGVATNAQQGMIGNGGSTRIIINRANTFRLLICGSRNVIVNGGFTGRNSYEMFYNANNTLTAFHNNNFVGTSVAGGFGPSDVLWNDLGVETGEFDFNLSACITAPRSTINRDLVYNAIINYFNRLRQLPPNTLISTL